jgi:hypothetical protein
MKRNIGVEYEILNEQFVKNDFKIINFQNIDDQLLRFLKI